MFPIGLVRFATAIEFDLDVCALTHTRATPAPTPWKTFAIRLAVYNGPKRCPMRRAAIDVIAAAPTNMRAAVRGLDDAQLDTPYRPEGWTVRQVVHHVPDSHLNAYIRFKWALTEDCPSIKAYDEAAWAKLEDSRTTPVETSLTMLEMLHDRWVRLLRSLSATDYSRKLIHPENGPMTLDGLLATYEWHSRHHVAHVVDLRRRSGWA